mgnify:FL=1|jgi:hypothetical protein|tara:strand:- start:257 stop:796 length:540 start_codon:yes stop_codon:yes gene_type:complete
MMWRKLLFIIMVQFVFSIDSRNQIKVDFNGEDRDLTSINWNGTNIDFTTVDISALDAGYIEIQNLVVISELSSNSQIKITATHGGWSTLPTGYTGNKTSTTGDVQIKIDNLASGFYVYSGSNYGNVYTAISNSGSDHIIETAGAVSGLTGDINARVLLDWSTDIAGSYVLSLDFTVTNY